MNSYDINYEMNRRKLIINNFISQKLFSSKLTPQKFNDACNYLFNAGGKRVRSTVCTLSCEVAGGNLEWILPSAAAIEFLHVYSLIHDDLIDHGSKRRGVPSINVKHGDAIAILTGDALLTKAYEAISYSKEISEISDEQVISLFETLTKSSLDLCEGQVLDIEYSDLETIHNISENECLTMTSKKTGSLIAGGTKCSGIVSNISNEKIDALWEFGRCFGTCFQIIDDVLDVIGKKDSFGKPIGGDIKEGKCTLMIVFALKNLEGRKLTSFTNVLGNLKASDSEIIHAISLLHDSGAINYAINTAESILKQGHESLNYFNNSLQKDLLCSLTPALALNLAGVDINSLESTNENVHYW